MTKIIKLIKNSLLAIIPCFIISCSPKKDAAPLNVIPVERTVGNYNILNLSDYATDIRYVPLETNSSALVAEVKQIVYENSKILVSDSKNNCYLFDTNGEFCCNVGEKGQGPNEYNYMNHVLIHDNLIFLNDRFKILLYDTNGDFVENINFRTPELPLEYNIRKIVPLKRDTFVMDVVTSNNEYVAL